MWKSPADVMAQSSQPKNDCENTIGSRRDRLIKWPSISTLVRGNFFFSFQREMNHSIHFNFCLCTNMNSDQGKNSPLFRHP